MRRLLGIFLIGWLATTSAYSATSNVAANYEIEVLVFETQLPELEGAELWTRLPQPAKGTTMAPELLPPSADFATAIASMRTDGRHRVLVHKHWIQSAESKSNGPAVPLTTEDNQLNGTIKFYLSRFLHVELNVAYQPQGGAIGSSTNVLPATADANANTAPTYVISEQRRVRSNDMNYFDHPKFGVLVRVSPSAG